MLCDFRRLLNIIAQNSLHFGIAEHLPASSLSCGNMLTSATLPKTQKAFLFLAGGRTFPNCAGVFYEPVLQISATTSNGFQDDICLGLFFFSRKAALP